MDGRGRWRNKYKVQRTKDNVGSGEEAAAEPRGTVAKARHADGGCEFSVCVFFCDWKKDLGNGLY